MGLAPHELVKIRLLGHPVLCIDTCSILDLLRDPTRGDADLNSLRAALDLVDRTERGDVVVLIAEQVGFEFAQHLPMIEADASAALQKHCLQVQLVNDIANLFGGAGTASTSHLPNHVARARAVAERFIARGIQAFGSDRINTRAFQRVNFGRTPGGTGKQSMKDCVIVESYLDAARELRHSKFPDPIVFLSSNTKDYCKPTTRTLPSDLAGEFASLSMEYAPNWAAAKHLLGV